MDPPGEYNYARPPDYTGPELCRKHFSQWGILLEVLGIGFLDPKERFQLIKPHT